MTADAVGGVWTYALELAGGLRERETGVDLAVLGPGLDDTRRRAARKAGVVLHEGPFDLEWMPDPWDDVDRAGEWLLDLEARLRPDVVHLDQLAFGALPWNAPTLVVGHSCVGSWWRAVRGAPPPSEWDEYGRRVTESLRAATLVVAPTRAMLAALERLYGPFHRGRAIHNGRDPGARRAPAEAPEPLVLTAGRLWDPAKNVRALDRAAARVRWPVAAAGPTRGPAGEELVLHRARPLGMLDPDALDGWLRRAAIFALPARYEPFGYGPLEAAQAGCALVLGDIASLREVWGSAAVYVEPEDSDALADAIDRLADDDDRRRSMAARAASRATRYGVAAMTEAYLRAYRRLAGAPATPYVHPQSFPRAYRKEAHPC